VSFLVVTIPVTLLLAGLLLGLVVLAVRSGDFDDLDGPALRMLHDDDATPERDAGPSATLPAPSRPSGDRFVALVEVTESAAERIKQLLDKEGKLATHGLRLKVVGGGCSGLQYELSFDDQLRENDSEVERGGVRVIVDEKSALYLLGTTLDYVDTLVESGFKIQNPNAKTTCGCGQSFGA
jgi:iron-sulfur cluster assembly protein